MVTIMRWLLVCPLALAALSVATPAVADCIGPFDCFCTWNSTTTPNVVAVVTSVERRGDQSVAQLEVESVHAADPSATAVRPGDGLTVAVWQDLKVGDRVLAELVDAGGVSSYNLVRERDDGSVECGGFSSPDLTITDLIEVRLSEDCYAALQAQGATFESPPCNDVVSGPFGCTNTWRCG